MNSKDGGPMGGRAGAEEREKFVLDHWGLTDYELSQRLKVGNSTIYGIRERIKAKRKTIRTIWLSRSWGLPCGG